MGSAVWSGVKTVSKAAWKGAKTAGKFLWKHKWKTLTVAAVVTGVVLVVGATGGVGALLSPALSTMLVGGYGGKATLGAWCFSLGTSSIIHGGLDYLNNHFNGPSVPASAQEVEPLVASTEASSQEEEAAVPTNTSYGATSHEDPSTEHAPGHVTTPQVPSEGASAEAQKEAQEQPPNGVPYDEQAPDLERHAPEIPTAARAQEEEDDNVEEVYTDYRAVHSDASASSEAHENAEEDRKMPATPAAATAQAEEDHKMPNLPHVTTFNTPEAAQGAVASYLARWHLATPEGRTTLRIQGKEILQGVEALKKATKQSYRHQVLSFETQDIDPLVWGRVLQDQKTTQAQLHAVRGLRTQLLDACQVYGAELKEAGIPTIFDEDGQETGTYSSDEEDQQLSSEEMRDRQESLKKVAELTKEVAEAIMESGPTLGAGAAVKVAGKIPKVLKATKAVGQAVQGVASKQFKAVSLGYLQKVGIKNLHAFKASHLGTNKNLSHFDVVKHTNTNKLLIIRKSTQEIVCSTNVIVK